MSDSEEKTPKKTLRKKLPKHKAKANDQYSAEVKCPQCDSIVQTYSAPETTYFTVIASFITLVLFGIWSMFLLPFVIPLSKAIIIRCTRCGAKLETHQPFGLFSLKDEVMTLKCGECALVISRSYLLTVVSVIVCVFVYFWATSESIVIPVIYLSTTWPEYLEDCGGEVVLKNTIRVTETFTNKYEGNSITWDGYLMRANENYGWFRGDHAVVLLVKMEPSESDIHADLILSMSDTSFYANRPALASLDRGSKFRFNATFVSPGNEQQLHHLHADYIEKIDGFLDIPPHVHNANYRYTLKTQNAQSSS